MTDIGTGFVRAIEAFLNTRLGDQAEEAWHDTGSFLSSLTTFSADPIKARFEELKKDITDGIVPLAKDIAKAIEKQTTLIGKMITESKTDLETDDFNVDQATRVAIRIGMVLSAADEAYSIIASELSKDGAGNVQPAIRDDLMLLWSPFAKPFKDIAAGASNLLNAFGKNVLGIDDLVGDLSKVITLDRTGGGFMLVAKVAKSGSHSLGPITLDQISFEAFLQFSDREVTNPTAEEKLSLVERKGKWYMGDLAILGVRLRTLLEPGLTKDPLLKKVMPGAKDPETTTITAISLDTGQGLYLGDGRGSEKAVLPVRWEFPGVELREVALGIVRDSARDATGLELTTSIAAKIGKVVGLQVVGSGFILDMGGLEDIHVMFDQLPLSPRWPDAIGLRIDAAKLLVGGGYIERKERTYKIDGVDVKRVEFGGTVQLQFVKSVGITAIVILAPDPFSLVMIIGVRFGTPINLSLGFTLNAVGGILALDRTIDLEALRAGMRDHALDKMLFPDDPVSEAPKLLDQVAHIFPPRTDGFVIGPIAELGWGSQAKFVKLKVGVVFALPDPKIVIVGSLSVQVPHEKLPTVDIKAELFVAITPDHLLLFATMKGSKIGIFDIDGDLGLYIQWSGQPVFELSVGGFHPDYEKLVGTKPALEKSGALTRVTLDFSPGGRDAKGNHKGPIVFTIKLYFAVTAGSVQLGVDGLLKADFSVIVVKAWLKLDMIFIWAPRFAFKFGIVIGASVELFGVSLASVEFRGELEGTKPYKLSGHVRVDVWFLPTFDETLGPIEWGEPAPPPMSSTSALTIVKQALDEPQTWKALLPDHAAQLVTLAPVELEHTILAHPLSAIEVAQSQVPLGVKISHIGAAPVVADMVTIGTPRTTVGDAAAVSPLMQSFPPGHYFDLEGEKLLGRAGFEDMQGGYRIAMATTPVHGTSRQEDVAYRTYIRDEQDVGLAVEAPWRFAKYDGVYAATSVTGRRAVQTANPYVVPQPEPPVALAPAGASLLVDAATGAPVLAGWGSLSPVEADLIGAAALAAGAADVTRVTVRG